VKGDFQARFCGNVGVKLPCVTRLYNCEVGCARFTIPLFNETHTKAIIYEEEVYNPIAACGLIKVFVFEHDKWMEYKSFGIWLM
jgi:hypothetical protein